MFIVKNLPTHKIRRIDKKYLKRELLKNDIQKNEFFCYSDGHDRPAVVTAAMLQYCRFLESIDFGIS